MQRVKVLPLVLLLAPVLVSAQENAAPAASAPAEAAATERTATSPGEEAMNRLVSRTSRAQQARLRQWFGDFASDQRAIWTSPSRIRVRDASWLMPLGGVTAVLIATDGDITRHLSNSPNRLHTSRQVSDFGAGALVGAAGGLFLLGEASGNEHKRETGLLAGEALLSSLALGQTIKFATGRERPADHNARGIFGQGGSSFPSDHAIAAWSVASVIAHEYPGPLTKLLAYGLATAVSASRITGKQHFSSDVLVGSAIGWFVGQRVYRARHNPELGGSGWETPSEMSGEAHRNPANMGSPYVPLDSWVYPALERLAALGYVSTAFLGMRPWTRLECARLVDEVTDHITREESERSEAIGVYHALESEFAPESVLLGGGRNRGARVDALYARFTGIAGKPLKDGYHFAQTIINDDGRPYAEGANVVTGFSGWGTLGPLAAYVRGEFQHAPSAPALPQSALETIQTVDGLPSVPPALGTPSINRFDVVEGYAAFAWNNWQISAGKQSLWWSPDAGGAMMFSNNAEPVNMIRITRVSPLRLPSIFGLLGPIRTEFFLGQLSGHQLIFTEPDFSFHGQLGQALADQPMITGGKLSFKPTPNLEFGLSPVTIFGGAGMPVTARSFYRALFSLTNSNSSSSDPGDRDSGFNMSYRLPGLRNWVTFYTDSFTDDEFTPLAYFDRAANSAGLYLPRLPKLPKFDLRVEGVYTDNPIGGKMSHGNYYFNVAYRNGRTNAGNLLESWIGRQGQGAQAWLTYWHGPKSFLRVNYRHQKVSQQFIPYGGTVNDANVRADWLARADLSLSAFVQYERWNFPVLAAQEHTNVTASFQMTFRPRWQIR